MKYTECEKLTVTEKRQVTIRNFLQYLEDRDWIIASLWDENMTNQLSEPESVINDFLGIDAKKLEEERQYMIDNLGKK